ncbi:MAG: hypothetical protein A3I11_07245 [Elusimicrobia bacterium RIFCSPLOWO2_02_FULL_39_32]|nr:MAG: hypothetical protein A2034_07775 [Elusimicrobia bacterium GWA2_38_7]OGR81452.1 MAG: hypothetical protein A3B80_05380 [Elusimicrobia bacterium RIFCSPHIGHO2_02_FULL_39_36]OGR91980.1 MAG: hypothetical protein A3I11_07245 [Elusimicrobia bacterium RIFCSPLOWO2_02_FULL_39_32]OGR98728.1 MAG: hypothetical protein A3G85_05185 [Elusimicrobia bacterium RIFCSPLOWO2_12_FULL_39_28]
MGNFISPNRKLLNVEELSEYIGTPVGTLYQWVSQRKIPYVKLGRSTKFDVEKIREWISVNSVEEKIL